MLKILSRDLVRLSAQTQNEKLVPINSATFSSRKKTEFAILPSSTTHLYKNTESVFLETPKHVRHKMSLTHLDRGLWNS